MGESKLFTNIQNFYDQYFFLSIVEREFSDIQREYFSIRFFFSSAEDGTDTWIVCDFGRSPLNFHTGACGLAMKILMGFVYQVRDTSKVD